MNGSHNAWKISTIVLIVFIILLTGTVTYSFIKGYVKLSTESQNVGTEYATVDTTLSTDDVKTEEESTKDTTTVEIPAMSDSIQEDSTSSTEGNSCSTELADGWKLELGGSWHSPLDSDSQFDDSITPTFVKFFNNAIAYMKTMKSYNFASNSIGNFKGNDWSVDINTTVLGDEAVQRTISCKGIYNSSTGDFKCSEAQTTVYEKEVISSSNSCNMIKYSKTDGTDWTKETFPFNKATGYFGISMSTNPLYILGLSSGSGDVVYVVGAKAGGKASEPVFGQAIDIVYLQTIKGSDRYYFALNFVEGKLYRIVEYGPNNSSAEYIYSDVNGIATLPD